MEDLEREEEQIPLEEAERDEALIYYHDLPPKGIVYPDLGLDLRVMPQDFLPIVGIFGRTLFDLEETTARIKQKTRHLQGVKIGIMGCIVNGPGEMADADFGYVGSGPGRVTLYVGRRVVARNVPEEQAPDRLIELIREHGRWCEPRSDAPD